MCVRLSNFYIDLCYGHGNISTIDAVFVLTVLCQRICVATNESKFYIFPQMHSKKYGRKQDALSSKNMALIHSILLLPGKTYCSYNIMPMFNQPCICLVAYYQGIPLEFPGNREVLAILAGTPSPKRSHDSKESSKLIQFHQLGSQMFPWNNLYVVHFLDISDKVDDNYQWVRALNVTNFY